MTIKLLIVPLLSMVLASGCSSKNMITDSSIVINEVNCWLNLMPGGEPSFHYSGVILIYNNIIEQTTFSSVKVYYQNQLVHQSKPLLQFTEQIVLQSEKVDKFLFYSEQGIKVSETLMKAENLDFVFEFAIDDIKVEKKFDNVQLTRAY